MINLTLCRHFGIPASMVHVHTLGAYPYPSYMSMPVAHVYVHSACPCPWCMFMPMLHVHDHVACPCPCCMSRSMSLLHVHFLAACPRPCPCCMPMPLLHAGSTLRDQVHNPTALCITYLLIYMYFSVQGLVQ